MSVNRVFTVSKKWDWAFGGVVCFGGSKSTTKPSHIPVAQEGDHISFVLDAQAALGLDVLLHGIDKASRDHTPELS